MRSAATAFCDQQPCGLPRYSRIVGRELGRLARRDPPQRVAHSLRAIGGARLERIDDVEELLTERGITVDHVTVYRWVQRYTPLLIDAARPCRHAPGDRWFVDETYAKVAGRWVYLYRAIDQFGQVIDVLISEKRDLAATRRFFTRALEHGPSPIEVTTDHAAAYPRVLDGLAPAVSPNNTKTTRP